MKKYIGAHVGSDGGYVPDSELAKLRAAAERDQEHRAQLEYFRLALAEARAEAHSSHKWAVAGWVIAASILVAAVMIGLDA